MAKTINDIKKELGATTIFSRKDVEDLIYYAYSQGRESTLIKIKDDPKFKECFDEVHK